MIWKEMDMFKGSITALITPFKGGEIDWDAFEALVEMQIEQGSHGVVPCGTTGESPTVTHDEHIAIVKRCVEIVKQRIPVLAGTGSNSTAEAISLTCEAQDAGADGALIVTPYYNKPTQDGMIAHFTAIHEAADIPIVLYNIPGRCVVDMSDASIAKVAKLPRIVGVKDATGDLSRVKSLRALVGDEFTLLSGNDDSAGDFMEQGGDGIISVVANVAARMNADMIEAWQNGDEAAAKLLCAKLSPLAHDLFCEANPSPVKYGCQVLGICSDEVRLPLLPASAQARVKVDAALAHAGLVTA